MRPPKPGQRMKPQYRTHWKPLLSLALVLTVGVVTTWLFVRQPPKRTVFFGETDPMTGYRCRIKLSSDWKQEPGDLNNPTFVAPPLSPVQQWIHRYLLRRPVANPAKIYLRGYPQLASYLSAGYPEIPLGRGYRVLQQRHFHIDGYAATLVIFETPANTPSHGEWMAVYVPSSATLYTVAGMSEPANANGMDREIQGVIDSFQVEKAPVSGTDLEVIETGLSDWQAQNETRVKTSGNDEIVVYNRCLENLKPKNRKLILSDMKAFTADLQKARTAPGYDALEDSYKVYDPTWKKFFPHAFAYIYVGRPTYPDSETAILELRSGPEPHGDNINTYTLKRKQGKWSIVNREILHPL